jgi:hypothetical protein
MDCKHENTEIRFMASCGQIKSQCLNCGQSTSNAISHSKFSKEEIDTLPRFDEQLRADWWNNKDLRRKEVAESFAQEAKQKLADRKLLYHDHLKSEKWKEKRRLVIQKQNNICQGCLNAEIDDIHHLSYDNLGDELLFQLIGLCRDCHKKTHGIQ